MEYLDGLTEALAQTFNNPVVNLHKDEPGYFTGKVLCECAFTGTDLEKTVGCLDVQTCDNLPGDIVIPEEVLTKGLLWSERLP